MTGCGTGFCSCRSMSLGLPILLIMSSRTLSLGTPVYKAYRSKMPPDIPYLSLIHIFAKLWICYSKGPPTPPVAYRSIEISSPRLLYGRAANYRCLIIPEWIIALHGCHPYISALALLAGQRDSRSPNRDRRGSGYSAVKVQGAWGLPSQLKSLHIAKT